jgi:hypothetical protein
MTRTEKLEMLSKAFAGQLDPYELFVCDGFWLLIGGYYVADGLRIAEADFNKRVAPILSSRGIAIEIFSMGNGSATLEFMYKQTTLLKL